MWLKSYKGALYNTDHFAFIELTSAENGEWWIIGQWPLSAPLRSANQSPAILAKFTSKDMAQSTGRVENVEPE